MVRTWERAALAEGLDALLLATLDDKSDVAAMTRVPVHSSLDEPILCQWWVLPETLYSAMFVASPLCDLWLLYCCALLDAPQC